MSGGSFTHAQQQQPVVNIRLDCCCRKMDFTGRRKSPHPKRILAGGGVGTVPLEPIVEMRVGLTSQLHGGNYQLFNLLPPAAMGANHLQQELGSQHHPEPIITITKVLKQGPCIIILSN